MTARLAGLTDTERAAAKPTTSFNDIVLDPDQDGRFPSTEVGLQAAYLTDEQRELILAAIDPWRQHVDPVNTATLHGIYAEELDGTYIAFSGNAALAASGDYVRIDRPSVWIELVCQNGAVIPVQMHYCTIWRNRRPGEPQIEGKPPPAGSP